MNHVVKAIAIVLFLSISLGLNHCPAQEGPAAQAVPTPTLEDVCRILSQIEIQEMNETLMTWTDPILAEKLSRLELSDDYVRGLYEEFRSILVTPPDPETYTEYGIVNGKESLVKALELGKSELPPKNQVHFYVRI
jgi:hypothetical protein